MLFKLPLIAIIATLLALAGAFKVPEGQPDGTYAITINDDGTEEHTPINTDKVNNSTEAEAITKRAIPFPNSFIQCNQAFVPYGDYISSIYLFNNACASQGSKYLYSTRAIYAVSGSSVSYMCNYSGSGNPCNTAEWSQVLTNIQNYGCVVRNSGVQSGFLYIGGWLKSYGYDAITVSFC